MTTTRSIPEDVLEAMLAETGEVIAVPSGGARAAVAFARQGVAAERHTVRRPSWLATRGRVAGALAGVAILTVVGVTIAGHHSAQTSGTVADTAAATVSAASSAAPVPAAGAPAAGARAAASPAPQSFAGQEGALIPGAAAGALGPLSRPSATAQAGSTTSTASGTAATTSDAVVVRTGNASVVVPVKGVPSAVAALEGDAKGFGGYLQGSNTGSGTATVTLRVPAADFEALLAKLPGIGTVTSSSSSSQDVTGQSVDLAARLKAAQASRDTYLTILTKASSIGDVLSVQQRLDSLQTEIEQLQAQQKTLDAQASFATLAVSVMEKAAVVPPAPAPAPPRSGFSLAVHQAYDNFTGGLQDVVASGGTLALLLLGALIAYPLLRVGVRRYQRAML